MRVDALQVAQDVEMQRAGLNALRPSFAQALEMMLGRGPLHLAHRYLLAQELSRDGNVL